MNSETQQPQTQIVPQKDAKLVVQDDSSNSYLMDTARFEHSYRIAKLMASASLLPDHLWMNKQKEALPESQIVGNCFLIVNQSLRWGFDPFAVAPETYSIGGKLGFQGKLIAAVVNSRAGLRGRLDYEFIGDGEKRGVIVSGTFANDSEPHTVTVLLAAVRTQNDMWKRDPDQKLCYTGAIKWARRWCPEVVLGVATDDDLEMIKETSEAQTASREPAAPVPEALRAKVVDVLPTRAEELQAKILGSGFTHAEFQAATGVDPFDVSDDEARSQIDSFALTLESMESARKPKGGKK